MSRAIVSALLALGLAASVPATAGARAPLAASAAEALWARVLLEFVDLQGRIDFRRLAGERADLDAYVAWVGQVSPRSAPARFPTRQHELAYHINAYNALSMHGVLESGLPESLGGLRKFYFFGVRSIRVGNETLTLYSYENDTIRAFGDPRVHFALNCMSISCPRLPRVPFAAATLDAELDAQARAFLAEPRNLEVDRQRKVVTLSEIFDFYTEDFLRADASLVAYVNRYGPGEPIPESYGVQFFDYDWGVNFQPR